MLVSYYVGANKVEVLKSKVREEGEVKFCSTHDLITSHFCNATQNTTSNIAIRDEPTSTPATFAYGSRYRQLLLDVFALLFGPEISTKSQLMCEK